MFKYFPKNYMWSSAVLLSITAGGQLGQIDRQLASLRDSYRLALEAFGKAVETMPRPLERVEIDSPDGILPGWLIPARGVTGPAPRRDLL